MTNLKILVLAEHDNNTLLPATRKTCAGAAQLSENCDITVLVAGYGCEAVVNSASQLEGITRVLHCEAEHYKNPTAENFALLLKKISVDYQVIMATASTFGKNVLPRLAALLEVSVISEVIKILAPDTFIRPTYAGNVLTTVCSQDPIKVLTIRGTAFEEVGYQTATASKHPVEIIPAAEVFKNTEFLRRDTTEASRPDLSQASIVVSGGRGFGNKENFKLLEAIADSLGAAIGASRAAVDAGFAANDLQVGQTGKVVAPELYIAIGISGAIQHVAGMKDSKIIVAINKDAEAPIFQVADYGLVGDLFQILPELQRELTVRKTGSAVK